MTTKEIIIREQNKTDVSNTLVEMLKNIYDENDFILAVLMYAKSDSDRQIIIDFINAQDPNDEQITMLALKLYQQHHAE